MSATAGINQVPASLDVAGLVEAVRGAEPAALFVLPRVLRRVIKQHADLPGFGIRIPHRKSYVIPCEALLEIADREELGLQPDEPVPEQVILLPRPGPAELARASAAEVLTEYWRLLFHARIHMALRQRRSAGELSPPAIRRRIQRIGSTEFDEIRLVLQQEALLLPPWDDGVVYEEFAAVYLELRYFSRSFLPRYFPGIERTERIEGLLAEDVDAQSLFEATRPPGAPDPQDSPAAGTVEQSDRMAAEGDEPQPEAAPERIPSEGTYQRLVRRAEAAAARGNTVRSAIWRAKAEQYAPLASLAQARAALRGDVEHLARRLLAALESRQTDPRPWQETLLALARQAARGIWTAEARLLYDLQKVCVDRERGLYTVDLVEWGLSLGRRPVKRPLPNQQDVLICKHLRSAARRLAAVRLSQANRRRLSTLLHRAAEEAEERLRSRYRPLIGQALHEVGLRPMNLPERIGREKLIEELLDRVLERGFLTVGDLRDGISRNNLKIPDCAELRDFLSGDELLRADKRLAEVLDGVYNRAEIYLRGMLRLSSWAFGTKVGRFLTRFLAVPFGGAFLIVAFVEHLAETIHRHAEPPWQLRLIQVLLLGMFLFGLIHFESFRRGAWRLTRAAFRGLRAAVVRPITWFVHLPLVTWIVRSRLFKLFVRFVFKPLAYTTAAWLTTPLERVQWHDAALLAAAIFLLMNLLLNSRVGRNLEEMAADALVQAWRRFGLRVLTNLFWLLVDLFRWIVQAIERMLYAVDEWLRFRSGQSRMTLVWKGILGLIWFFLTYVIRFCVNLLIEPQINPIKHFPVVTVSHKLLLPMIPALAKMLMAMSVEKHLAATLATAIIFSIPGIFGFLVWELKENWRLYEANRARHLKPVPIGHHGETMMRLLRPGLHSGTVPKRYARLRRAERKARATGNWRAVRKHLVALEHLELALGRFVQRELSPLLAESRWWGAPPLDIERVQAGTNRVVFTLRESRAGLRLRLAFAVEAGWLIAEVLEADGLETLSPGQREVLRIALLGLYKLAGAELVRQQIDSLFPPPAGYALDAAGLLVWPDKDFHTQVRYDLRSDESSFARPVVEPPSACMPPSLERKQAVFAQLSIPWSQWVAIWQQDQQGQPPAVTLLPRVPVLPAEPSSLPHNPPQAIWQP